MNGWLQAAVQSAGVMDWLRGRAAWMEGFAATPHATVWLFAFAFAESSFFPIPPDILLIALCLTQASLSSVAATAWYVGVCTAGSALGGAFGYFLGVKAGRPILNRLAKPKTVESAERLLRRYDVWAVGAAGFTPIPYKIFTIASGMLGVKLWRFFAVSVASRGARFLLVATLCHAFGEDVKPFLRRHFGWATLAFVVTLVGSFYAVGVIARRLRPGVKDGRGPDGE